MIPTGAASTNAVVERRNARMVTVKRMVVYKLNLDQPDKLGEYQILRGKEYQT